MNLDTPTALTVETWNKQKAALAKDKASTTSFPRALPRSPMP